MIRLLLQTVAALLLLHTQFAPAHEGEDHGAAPPPLAAPAAGPRMEAATADLELVAVLQEKRLVIYLDRYASNEPITAAQVEIESGQYKALARPAADGTYVADAEWLGRPGAHSLVITVQAPDVSDLVAGTLEVPGPPPAESGRRLGGTALLAAAGGVGLLLLAGAWILRRRRHNAAAAALLAAALLLPLEPPAAGAHEGEVHEQDRKGAPPLPAMAPAGATPARLPDGSVWVSKPAQRLLGIRTAVAQVADIPRAVELFGHVVADPNASGRVQAPQAGRVEPGPRGFPSLGQRVRKGDVLAYLVPLAASIERGNQQAQLAELESALAIATAKAARYEQLEGSIPRKEIEAARAELESLKARREAVAGSLHRREPLAAPVSGVVSAMSAASGQVVEAREVLFDVIDPARLWVEAVAYDMSLSGQIAGARAVSQAGQPVSLTFLGAGYQLREQALPLQFRLDPPLPPISVGEKMKLFVQTKQRVGGVALPQAALTRNASGETVAWVHASAEQFMPRRVKAQALDGARVVVVEGLKGGERVVTEGAALLAQVR